LEQRTLLSTIVWTNKGTGAGVGDTDDFNLIYGANATTARGIVQRAIDDWERVIVNFNYSGGGNSYNLAVNAAPISGRGVTNVLSRNDAIQKKPTSAEITLDDNAQGGGWYFDTAVGSSTVPDDGEFTTLLSPFTARSPTTDNDFYRTIVHEIGHAMGLGDSSGYLKIGDFLTNGAADPNDGSETLRLLDYNGGGTDYTLTTAGGGHLFEGGGAYSGPTHPNDLMNDGRTVPLNTNIRELITNTDATLLHDVYSYTILLPSTINTFYANLNTTTNVLTVNGDLNQNGIDADNIDLEHSGTTTTIEANGFSEAIPDAQFVTLTVNAGAGNDNIDVNALASGKTVTVNGDADNDRIDVAQDNDDIDTNILSDFTANGGAGVDTVTFNDGLDGIGADTYGITSSVLTKSIREVSYSSIDLVQIFGSPQASTYTITSTSSTTDYTISGGSLADSFIVGTGDIDSYVLGSVTITGNGGADSLLFDDSTDTLNDTYELSNNDFTKSSMTSTVTFTTVESITIDGSAANNTFTVFDFLTTVGVTLNGNEGDDTFEQGYYDMNTNWLGNLTINGGAGSDGISLNDSNDGTADEYTVNLSSFGITAGITTNLFSYSTVESFAWLTNTTSATIKITATSSICTYEINGNAGGDTFQIGNIGGNAEAINGALTLIGDAGTDSWYYLDSTNSFDNTYSITSTSITRTANALVTFSTFENATLNSGTGDMIINVATFSNLTAGLKSLEINAGAGADSINLGSGDVENNLTFALITVNGGGGGDHLYINDSTDAEGNDNYTLTSTTIDKDTLGANPITYGGIEFLLLDANPFNNIISVDSLPSLTPVTVNGNNGADTFDIGGGDWDTNLFSNVTINGGTDAATDAVVIDDTSDVVADSYTVTSTSSTKNSTSVAINYSNIEQYTLDANDAANTITVISAFSNFRVNGNGGADTFDVQGNQFGTFLTVDGGAGLDSVMVNSDGAGAAAVQFPASQDLALLHLYNGGQARLNSGADKVLITSQITIDGNGKLDLADNGMIVDYTGPSPVDTIRTLLTSGYAAGAWNGTGINSSVAAVTANRALGLAESTDVFLSFPATFMGQSVDSTAVLVRYTLRADANLDLKVDITDLYKVASNWQQAGRRWGQGDFNFDQLTNAKDLGILSLNWQAELALPTPPVLIGLPVATPHTPTRAPVRASVLR
jgi:hypothetical protein